MKSPAKKQTNLAYHLLAELSKHKTRTYNEKVRAMSNLSMFAHRMDGEYVHFRELGEHTVEPNQLIFRRMETGNLIGIVVCEVNIDLAVPSILSTEYKVDKNELMELDNDVDLMSAWRKNQRVVIKVGRAFNYAGTVYSIVCTTDISSQAGSISKPVSAQPVIAHEDSKLPVAPKQPPLEVVTHALCNNVLDMIHKVFDLIKGEDINVSDLHPELKFWNLTATDYRLKRAEKVSIFSNYLSQTLHRLSRATFSAANWCIDGKDDTAILLVQPTLGQPPLIMHVRIDGDKMTTGLWTSTTISVMPKPKAGTLISGLRDDVHIGDTFAFFGSAYRVTMNLRPMLTAKD